MDTLTLQRSGLCFLLVYYAHLQVEVASRDTVLKLDAIKGASHDVKSTLFEINAVLKKMRVVNMLLWDANPVAIHGLVDCSTWVNFSRSLERFRINLLSSPI